MLMTCLRLVRGSYLRNRVQTASRSRCGLTPEGRLFEQLLTAILVTQGKQTVRLLFAHRLPSGVHQEANV